MKNHSLPSVATEKQRKMFEYLLKHPYSIAAVDPRLGKTLVAISLQQTLNENCLVICPSYLTANWLKEIRKWSRPDTQATIFKRGKDIYEPVDQDFVIISYDLIQKAEHLFEWCDMVIIDEAHNLKSMSAKRTQFIHKCIFENSVKRVHPITGTIIKNRVMEFYPQISMMYYDPRIGKDIFQKRFPDEITFADYFSFRKEFEVKITDKKGRTYRMPIAKWEGIRRVDELKKYLKRKYIRIKADDRDLPPVTYNEILVSDSNDSALLQAFYEYFEGGGNSSVKPDIKAEAALKKVPFTIKYAEDLLMEVDCVLIYSDHVQPIEEIAKHFGVRPITGKMSAPSRSVIAADFQAGNGRVLCATIGALKEGQDLFRSKNIIFNDNSWVPGDMKQVINRIRGLGQKEPRTVHNIFGSPQDLKIAQALKEKIEIIESAT